MQRCFKKVSLEGIDTKRREDIENNRYSGASSEKAKISMLVKLALVQQESTFIEVQTLTRPS